MAKEATRNVRLPPRTRRRLSYLSYVNKIDEQEYIKNGYRCYLLHFIKHFL